MLGAYNIIHISFKTYNEKNVTYIPSGYQCNTANIIYNRYRENIRMVPVVVVPRSPLYFVIHIICT